MTTEPFEQVLREKLTRAPFQPFDILMTNGDRLRVKHRKMLFYPPPYGSPAVYFAENDAMEFVDAVSVQQIVDAPESAAA